MEREQVCIVKFIIHNNSYLTSFKKLFSTLLRYRINTNSFKKHGQNSRRCLNWLFLVHSTLIYPVWGRYQNWELILQELVRLGINPSQSENYIFFIEFRLYQLKLLGLNVVNFRMESIFIYCYFIYLFNCYISFVLYVTCYQFLLLLLSIYS